MKRTGLLAGIALVVPVALFAMGTDDPPLKEGLWSLHTVSTYGDGSKTDDTTLICRSHAYEEYVKGLSAEALKMCKTTETVHGNTRTQESACKAAGITILVTETSTYTGDTAIHSEQHSKYSPPQPKMTDSTIREHKYLGPCPANMKPGDTKDSDGTITHGWEH
jgi:hypothetical protein